MVFKPLPLIFPMLVLLPLRVLAIRPSIIPIGQGTSNITVGIINSLLATPVFVPTARSSGYSFTHNATTSSAQASPTSKTTLPSCKSIQYAFPPGKGGHASRAEAVKEAYQYAFDAYVEYAWGYDELQPLTKTGTNNWYGWGVTVVDGLDTAIIMNLTESVSKMLGWIQKVDFTTTPDGDVELFDICIRYLGGLLSSYDLLKSGQFYNGYDPNQVEALLTQAKILADKLAYGFLTPSGISAVAVDFSTSTSKTALFPPSNSGGDELAISANLTHAVEDDLATVGSGEPTFESSFNKGTIEMHADLSIDTPVDGSYTASDGVTYKSSNTAQAGTFLLEWYRLAALTGNTTYRSLVDAGEYYLVHPSPAPTYPGLVGTQFDTTSGKMLNFAGGWHSEVDSFVEYLIKIYHYKADNITKSYADFWLTAAQSTEEHLAVHPYGFDDLTFISAMDGNGHLTYTMDDYSCFAGGNFLLGCKVLGIDSLCDLGIAAADGCHQTYNTTATGLGPLYWGWYAAGSNTYPPNPAVDINNGYRRNGAANGEFIVNGDEGYGSFPESLESWFYAYRITGDPRWADYGWDLFKSLNTTARNSVAFATVNNVAMEFGGSQGNSLDSFFFAEVLKYMYLMFTEPDVVDLGQWVFNTECHPLRVQCAT